VDCVHRWVKDRGLSPFDTLFVRGASADVPSEGKSAFGAEMGDIATLLRCCGEHSLFFVDELARGTSPRDGTSLAGAILEEMELKGMSGFFATHLHGILSLPLHREAAVRLGRRRMAFNETRLGDRAHSYCWSYKIEEGACIESLALNTVERFGLSQDILKRAEAFLELVSDIEIGCTSSGDQGEKNISQTKGLKKKAGEVKEMCEGLPAISRFLEDVADTNGFSIPSQHLPPAQLARSPCVYVLQDGIDHRYFVGQTTNLSN
jgi:DNA mismatch repair ATPase MutS